MKKFVFVLMPFNKAFDDIYKLGIKDACKDLDIYCERVDEQYYEGSMLERIYNQINNADYIIADLSTQNPNVFYEVGYAYASSKKIILITQDGEDIPFDMKHYLHIIYDNKDISSLKEKIKNRLTWHKENDEIEITDWQFNVALNGVELSEEHENKILIKADVEHRRYTTMYSSNDISVSIQNCSENIINTKNFRISLELPTDLPITSPRGYLVSPKMRAFPVYQEMNVFPYETNGFAFRLDFDEWSFTNVENKKYQGQLVVNMPHKVLRYAFFLEFDVAIRVVNPDDDRL